MKKQLTIRVCQNIYGNDFDFEDKSVFREFNTEVEQDQYNK